jgi:hypothetical protein
VPCVIIIIRQRTGCSAERKRGRLLFKGREGGDDDQIRKTNEKGEKETFLKIYKEKMRRLYPLSTSLGHKSAILNG